MDEASASLSSERRRGGPRVLILFSDIGEGHASAARTLKDEILVVDPHGKVGFEFEPRERKAKKDPKTPPVKLDFTGLQPLGKCPRCGGKVFDTETGYVCERSQADKKPCKFKVGKTILQQDIAPDQLRKLLQDGRTDVLDKFISKAGKPFPACLVLDDAGKVTFEFPQRGEPDQPS